MLPRKLLIFKISRGKLHPFFLSSSNPEHLGIAKIGIDFYESNLGKPRSQIQFQELRYLIGSDKLADGLRYALERRYHFAEPQPRSKYILSPMELRLKLFEYVGSLPGGFSRDRRSSLINFMRDQGISMELEQLEDYLWSDDPMNHILSRSGSKPDPEEIIQEYNFQVLDTLLSHSRMLSLYASQGIQLSLGSLAKQLARYTRELGLIYDAWMHGSELKMDIYGPIELFGRPARFGWRLGLIFNRALGLVRSAGKWKWRIQVQLRRIWDCWLDSENLPELPSKLEIPVQELNPIFDSELELKFHQILESAARMSPGLISQIQREALPIAIGDLLLIPDFLIKDSSGREWYLEIVGYWRPEYTAKKRAKLQQLRKYGFENLILIVDQRYLEYFRDIGFPVFGYKLRSGRPDFQLGAMLRMMQS